MESFLLIIALWFYILFHAVQASFDATEYQVHNLPGVPILTPSWAGKIDVPHRHSSEKIFFWLFEAEEAANDDDLISLSHFPVWFNGGPGCSSLISMGVANGPFIFRSESPLPEANEFSWTKLSDMLYIDQPPGTGFSLAERPVVSNAHVTDSFISWLTVFYERFPHLRGKRTHLMGESYAGVFIPYFAEAILQHQHKLGINIQSVSLGDGTFGNNAAMSDVSIASYLVSQSRNLRLSAPVLEAFSAASTACGFTDRMRKANTYPPKGPVVLPQNPHGDTPLLSNGHRSLRKYKTCNIGPVTGPEITASILHNPCYPQCAIFQTAVDHLITIDGCFNIYNIQQPDCDATGLLTAMESYLNRPDVRHALHVSPSDPPYRACNRDILEALTANETDVTPPAYGIIPSLLGQGIEVHIYQGAYDMLVNHKGIELVIQNMTWNGLQGFQEAVEYPFPGGRWRRERGLSYHLFERAGHQVPKDRGEEAFGFVRDFVLGYSGYNVTSLGKGN